MGQKKLKPEETIDFQVRWMWAKISRLYNQEAAKSGGTMSVGYVLLNIDKCGTPSTKLGPKMGMESRSLTRTLKSMEKAGLIRREADEVDRRKVLVFLTEHGFELREKSRDVVITFNQFVKEKLGTKRLSILLEIMSDLNVVLDENHVFDESENN